MDPEPASTRSNAGNGPGGPPGNEATTARPPGSERRLLWAAVLTTLTLVAEAVGGLVSGSLALLADAGHMLVDASALVLAWLGARLSRRPPDARRSFGYGRLEVLAGFVNALTLLVLVAWIGWEAIERLRDPQPILSGVMLAVALLGLAVNLVVLRVLGGQHHGHGGGAASGHDHGGSAASGHGHGNHWHAHDHAVGSGTDERGGDHGDDHGDSANHTGHHRHADEGPEHNADHARAHATATARPVEPPRRRNLNLDGARLHVIGDLLGSVAAVAAAITVYCTGWTRIDPLLSLLVAGLILNGAWRLLRRAGHILLEGVPDGLDTAELAAAIATAHPDILDAHHVHVWQLGSGDVLATVHLRLHNDRAWGEAADAARDLLRRRFGIRHATIQVDGRFCPDRDCAS